MLWRGFIFFSYAFCPVLSVWVFLVVRVGVSSVILLAFWYVEGVLAYGISRYFLFVPLRGDCYFILTIYPSSFFMVYSWKRMRVRIVPSLNPCADFLSVSLYVAVVLCIPFGCC